MTGDQSAGPVETAPAAAGPAGRGALPAVVFVGFVLFGAASIATPALVLSGVGRVTADIEQTPAPTSRVVTTRAPATAAPGAAASGRVRVMNAAGTSTALPSGQHEVTFTWTLEGAQEGDPVVLHVYAGNQLLGEQRGVLDASVFSFSSGTFRISASLPCSSGGWTAEIVSIRGTPVDGDSEAVIRNVTCR